MTNGDSKREDMRESTMLKENIIKERSPKTINQSTKYNFLGLSLSTTSPVLSLIYVHVKFHFTIE